MQDVIFSGTELRKPLGYAYVAITLDNSDHSLAIDYDEVTVSRRLYRSGESEYMINGSACRLKDVNELYKRSDYITIHIHFTDKTKGMIDAKAIAAMKRGVRFINLARGEIVDDDAMLAALDTGWVAAYITDFPNNRLLQAPHVIAMPHLGASTPESEQNCAVMAVDELRDYLENGNTRNSVNLPAVSMSRSGVMRMCIIHRNIPAMLASITSLLSRDGVNVENLNNKSRGDLAYTLVDLGSAVDAAVIQEVCSLPGVIRVRVIQ